MRFLGASLVSLMGLASGFASQDLATGVVYEDFVNVFDGSEKSKIELSFAGKPWVEMGRTIEPDPGYLKLVERNKSLARPFRAWPAAEISRHLWRSVLPALEKPGTYLMHVRTTDMFGQTYFATMVIRVDP